MAPEITSRAPYHSTIVTEPSERKMMAPVRKARAVVRFERINLNDERYPAPGRFDLILCRNVLIYFEAATKQRVIARLLQHLEPGGFLFLGHAETATGAEARLQRVGPGVYTPR